MRRVYIETYGCQMNVSDSELIAGVLAGKGYLMVDKEDEADVVLLNTCAVREKAEDRIFGRLGWLKSTKDKRPEMVIGVAGCMAEHLKEKITKRAPYVNLLAGPDAYRRLPELIEKAAPADPMIDLRLDRTELYEDIAPKRQGGVSGWVAIMRGCDKFCTFCVVPFTRGRERSLPPDAIIKQALAMQAQGFSEVTLLGQTVSSYRHEETTFAALLRQLHEQTSLRIRFTSPYPTDFADDELLDTLESLPRVGHHLHLPVQSGSTAVLERMKRQYSAEQYLELMQRVQRRLPDFGITTDFIVGFPGESDEDFEQTLELSRQVRFDSAFMFAYSERSGTRAAKALPDDVPLQLKNERLQRLIKLQEQLSRQRSAERVGKVVEVLVDGENPKQEGQGMGRSSCFKTTVLLEGRFEPGQLVRARVEEASTHTLFARPVSANGSAGAS